MQRRRTMANPYLLLWLEAPLQSWGHDSRYGRRDSLNFPTKSGVLGIICSALGASGAQETLLAELSGLDMEVLAFARKSKDEPVKLPLLQDFQMVGSGYDAKDPWQSLLIPKTSEGKKAVGGGTKMTYRFYIQDMAFAVMFQVPANMADKIAQALIAPVWDLSLGRKNCVPTEFIYQGTFETKDQAEQKANVLAAEKSRQSTFRVVQGAVKDGEIVTLNDVPLQFGEQKRYRDRQVTVLNSEIIE